MSEEYCQEPEVPLQSISRISLVYNLKKPVESNEPDDKYEEYDPLSTVEALAKTVASFGFHVALCEQDDSFHARLESQAPQFVVNIAEGRGTARGREAQVPCHLESLGIPFWGSDCIALSVAMDKWLTGNILSGDGIPAPRSASFRSGEDLRRLETLFGECDRFVVKPRYEGSSKGIFSDSVAHTPHEAAERIRRVWERYKQPALVEEYLPGEEITVGIVGCSHPSVVGMMRIRPVEPRGEFLYSLEEKRQYLERIRYEGQDTIPSGLRDQIARFALQAFRALELRDLARVDFRLDGDGVPRIIDINPLPGLSPEYSDLPILHRLNGGAYPALIRSILESALARNGLAAPRTGNDPDMSSPELVGIGLSQR